MAENRYIALRGKDKAGILLKEQTSKLAAERFTMEYGLIIETDAHKCGCGTG